jgi:protein TonB
MRLTAFLFISVALHAVAVAYPAVLFERRAQEAIPVSVLDVSEADGETADDGRAEGKKNQSTKPRHVVEAQSIEKKGADKKNQAPESKTPGETSQNSTDAPGEIAMASSVTTAEAMGGFSLPEGNGSGGDSGSGGEGNSGSGPGSGLGSDGANGRSKFIQASYAYSPNPVYPDSARREGKEGRVILRVLVDERGRSKSVEVNRSSGSAALDQAAANAMKRWRFSPARSGDVPVESWVKVPVDFQLTDARD